MVEKEYIERRALTRKVRYIIEKHGLSNVIGEKLKKAIEDSTAADVVEVVRCKDCKHSEVFVDPIFGAKTRSCRYHLKLVAVKSEHFCSYGERKE